MAALDVDDAEPAHAERDAVGDVRAAVVRAAMGHHVRHPVEDVRRDAPAGARRAAERLRRFRTRLRQTLFGALATSDARSARALRVT